MKILTEHDEVLNVKYVICEACGAKTTEGMALNCFYPRKDGTVTQIKKYMCLECMSKGKKVPGYKPQRGVPEDEIEKDIAKAKDRYIK